MNSIDYDERLHARELIPEQEYETGLVALQAAATREREPQPVMGSVDVLVFERG